MDETVRQRLDRLLDETQVSDPHELATLIVSGLPGVVDKLTDDELRPALIEVLPTFTRQMMRGMPRMVAEVREDAELPTVTQNDGASSRSSVSGKWENVSSVLRGRYRGAHRHKLLIEFTADDARHAARVRRHMETHNAKAAARFEWLDSALREHAVDQVGDLPAEVLTEVATKFNRVT